MNKSKLIGEIAALCVELSDSCVSNFFFHYSPHVDVFSVYVTVGRYGESEKLTYIGKEIHIYAKSKQLKLTKKRLEAFKSGALDINKENIEAAIDD